MELNSQSLACRYISSIIWFLSFHLVEIYLADSYLGLKSKMSVYRGGKKKQTAFHLKLSSGETLDCCPFTLLPWWRQFIASTGETSVYRSLLLRALGASWASLCCEERRPPARRDPAPRRRWSAWWVCLSFPAPALCRGEVSTVLPSCLRGLGVDGVDVRRAGLPEAGAAEEIPAAPQAFVACFWKKLVRLERFDLILCAFH